MDFPPPHTVFYEALNDIETLRTWKDYKTAHEHECDFEEVDAAVTNSMDDFAKWFAQWVAFAPSRQNIKMRILMIWHAHFLSLSCQQMLRRSLEQRSFRCRVFFHIEEPTLQTAILSRCITRNLPIVCRRLKIVGPPLETKMWKDPHAYETELQKSRNE